MSEGRDWLRSFTVLREADGVACHVWADGGSECSERRWLPVRQRRGGSHRSVQDYVEASLEHLKTHHPKEYEEHAGKEVQ